MARVSKTTTLEEFIEAGSGITISYDNLSMVDEIKNTRIPIYNVISDYIPELMISTVTITLTEQEYFKYRFKPKLLAIDVYGNPELYFVILILNNMCSVKEFDVKKIKMLPTSAMNDLLSSIYNSNRDFLSQYNNKQNTL
ncbi:MAG: baseplate wedge protein 53 [Pseudobutyrivibrio sp.]|nr:baseplate wedge protein 53 [Pseudobutyrivibrio sp.]